MNSKLPSWLTTVTPFSKSLALLMFISFPFIGFFTGLWYAKQAVTNRPSTQKIQPYRPAIQPTTVSPTLTPIPSQRPTYKPELISPKPQSSTRFDRCGHIDRYVRQDWNGTFYKKLISNGIYKEDITDSCLSLDEKFLIFVQPGIYCSESDIYMYDTSSDKLEKANLNTGSHEGCLSSAIAFGTRSGTVIPLIGYGGDAGCSFEEYFEYDFTKNTVTLKKSYGICESDIIDGESGTWVYY